MKLLKLNLICIINSTSKNVLKFGLLISLNLKYEFSRKEDSSVAIGWNLLRFLRSLRSLHWLETPL